MRRIFTFSFIAIAFALASFNSFGQNCTTTTQDFSGPVTTFTGAKRSGTGTFTAPAVSSNQLRSTVTANSVNTFAITSPTFSVAASNPIINLTFTYGSGSQATITNVQYAIRYVSSTTNTVVETTPVNYAGGGCIAVTKPSDFSGTNYQVVAIYTVSDGNGNPSNGFIFFDNFGTNGVAAASVLPVKFQSLEATSSSNSVTLKWMVAAEEHLSGYDVEKSIDGKNFSKIGFVSASNQPNYSFLDSKASATIYYRIRSVDLDGRYAFSTIALVKAGKSLIVLNAYPSPFTNNFSLDHGTATAGSLITISAEDGRTIKTIIPTVGAQRTPVDLSAAKAGMYLVRFKNSNGDVETLKVLKQQ
jgi:hypothetical protein